jgi:hypothetical protein
MDNLVNLITVATVMAGIFAVLTGIVMDAVWGRFWNRYERLCAEYESIDMPAGSTAEKARWEAGSFEEALVNGRLQVDEGRKMNDLPVMGAEMAARRIAEMNGHDLGTVFVTAAQIAMMLVDTILPEEDDNRHTAAYASALPA